MTKQGTLRFVRCSFVDKLFPLRLSARFWAISKDITSFAMHPRGEER